MSMYLNILFDVYAFRNIQNVKLAKKISLIMPLQVSYNAVSAGQRENKIKLPSAYVQQ